MLTTTFKAILDWEFQKYKSRGYFNLCSITILYLFLYLTPNTMLYLSKTFPISDKSAYYFIGSYFSHLSAYILSNAFFSLLYYLEIPLIESYKINSDPWPWKSSPAFFKETLPKVFKQALINLLFTIPATILLTAFTFKYKLSESLPHFSEFCGQISFFMLCYDVFFYLTHRLLHLPWFYKTFHKKHHEFTVTISLAAEYSHFFEYLIGNSLPFVAGPLLYGEENIEIITWFSWIFIGTCYTAEAHSGYEIPWSPFTIIPFSTNVTYHDFHHSKNIGNYGSTTVIVDFLLGTNSAFFKNLNKIRID